MKIRKIDEGSKQVSRWSGGTTTQLAICPPTANYSDRDFLWRISSAVVELPESDFTPLPDYQRILMILSGKLTLSHDGGEKIFLEELEQNRFDGASHTVSWGKVTDFNLMMRKGVCDGRMLAHTIESKGMIKGNLFAREEEKNCLFYCHQGSALMAIEGIEEAIEIKAGEGILLEKEQGEMPVSYLMQAEEEPSVVIENQIILYD